MRDRQTSPGLTLIELLLVFSILAVLAAVAIPNLMRAGVRAKVARSRNDLRVVAGALETYHVDHGRYPEGRPTPGIDPFGIFSIYSLSALTTPIAYLTTATLVDPFGPILPSQPSAIDPRTAAAGDPDRPFPGFPDASSFLYFNYLQFASLRRNPSLSVSAFGVISVGPDRRDSFSVYYPFPAELPSQASRFGINTTEDTLYDPTNGVVSRGDITRWGGALTGRVRRVP